MPLAELEADDDALALMAQRRMLKRRAWLVCLAFPAMIGVVLYSVGGEGRAKEPVGRLLVSAINEGDNVQSNIKRDAAELAAAKAEIAAAEKAARQPPAKDLPKIEQR
jgi:hypothetical protein